MAPPDFDKTPFASKKFSAFFVTTVMCTVLMLVMLFTIADGMGIYAWSLMLMALMTQGFIASLMIGGQAAADKYLYGIKMVVDAGGKPRKMLGVDSQAVLKDLDSDDGKLEAQPDVEET